jgi:hypothetical protein
MLRGLGERLTSSVRFVRIVPPAFPQSMVIRGRPLSRDAARSSELVEQAIAQGRLWVAQGNLALRHLAETFLEQNKAL